MALLPVNFRWPTYNTLPFCKLSELGEYIRISCKCIELIGNCDVSVDLEASCYVRTYNNNQFLDSNFLLLRFFSPRNEHSCENKKKSVLNPDQINNIPDRATEIFQFQHFDFNDFLDFSEVNLGHSKR